MKRKMLSVLLLFLASNSQAQTVSDNFNWAPTIPVSSATSPNFNFCSGSQVNFEITTGNQQFIQVSSSGNPAITDGIIFPANTSTSTSLSIPINLRFSAEVCNLRIRFVDIDGVSGESLTGISPSYASLTSEIGTLFDPGVSSNAVDANIDNATGWVNWNGSLTNVSFNYIRPGNGFGLVIDSIIFECCEKPCECRHRTQLNTVGSINMDGYTFANVNVNSMGIPVRSICIDLPFYLSNVDDACIKCDPKNTEINGTILGAAPIAGIPGVLHDPHNLGYSRKICWNFPTPTVVNANVQIDMKFPAVVDLSCCKNSVSYCFDVTFTNEDCTACEYTICTKFPQTTALKEEPKTNGSQGIRYNDFMETNGFQLNPNPSDGKVEVQIQDESLIGGKLIISSTSGSVVFNSTVTKARETLSLSHFTKGTYVVSIENNGRIASALLMIK